MTQKHKWYNEIVAFAEGKIIQMRPADTMGWIDWPYQKLPPFSDPFYEFRIKPEPKPDVVRNFFFEPSHNSSHGKWYEGSSRCGNNIKTTFDGETGELKEVEVLK